VSTEIKMMAAQAALRKMVEGSSFSICTIDSIVEMLDVKPDRDTYQVLRTLHCVSYNQMPTELLEKLPELIHKVLTSPAFEASRINVVSNGQSLRLVKH
jgi:hypothetical protein